MQEGKKEIKNKYFVLTQHFNKSSCYI